MQLPNKHALRVVNIAAVIRSREVNIYVAGQQPVFVTHQIHGRRDLNSGKRGRHVKTRFFIERGHELAADLEQQRNCEQQENHIGYDRRGAMIG
jgi:hypothetical protein